MEGTVKTRIKVRMGSSMPFTHISGPIPEGYTHKNTVYKEPNERYTVYVYLIEYETGYAGFLSLYKKE